MIIPYFVTAMIFALFTLGGAGGSAYLMHEQFQKKHDLQQKNITLLRDTKMRLEAVQEYGARFQAAYPEIPTEPDLLTLYQALGVGDIVPVLPDNLVVSKVTNVVVSGERTPLYEICIGNRSDGLGIVFGSLSDGIEQMRRIDARSDLSYTKLSVSPARGGEGILLKLDALCFYGRVPMENN